MKFNGVTVRVIEHFLQRYPTVGDWIYNPDNGMIYIYVSKLGDWRYEALVARHEFDEAVLCIERGIAEKEVMRFDVWYEAQRLSGAADCQGEPGDHAKAPYRKEHFFATTTERLMAAELGVDWDEYDKAVQEL